MPDSDRKSVVVLGAAGLIGQFIASDLGRRGFVVTAVARRFTPAQRTAFGDRARETSVVDLSAAELAALLLQTGADVVVNCIGVLQDSPNEKTETVHDGLSLIHISEPTRQAEISYAVFCLKKKK